MTHQGSSSYVFHNGDGCGDIILEYGHHNLLQCINTVSNLFHIMSGCGIMFGAKSANMQVRFQFTTLLF